MQVLLRIFKITIACLVLAHQGYAQLDRTSPKVTIDFSTLPQPEAPEVSVETTPTLQPNSAFSFEIPDIELPKVGSLLSPKAQNGLSFKSNLDLEYFGKEKPKEIDFKNERETPRYLSTNERILQYIEGGEYVPHFPNFDFGNFETESNTVILNFGDDGGVLDGDTIRIIVNDVILINKKVLSRALEHQEIKLELGFNKIEVEAIDEGTSKPMSMYLSIRDGFNVLFREKSYLLSIGSKAKIVIVRK